MEIITSIKQNLTIIKDKRKGEALRPKTKVRLKLNILVTFNVLNIWVVGIFLLIVQISVP